MDPQAISFLETMGAIALVGAVAFMITLLAGLGRKASPAVANGQQAVDGPHWAQLVLAIALLLVVAALLFWQFAPQPFTASAEPDADWRGDARSTVFIAVMAILVGVGGVAFLIVSIANLPKSGRDAAPPSAATAGEAVAASSSVTGLLGLLLLVIALLLLGWIYLPRSDQYVLMLSLVYPASFALALVLLVDKATRTWSAKGAAETTREWLLGDGLVFLLVLGFLNLRQVTMVEEYAAWFWDLMYIVLFFCVFWLLDRGASRFRFLVTYGYLVLVPLLVLVWQAQQGVPAVEGASWWSSIWPFFFLALLFLVLEVVLVLTPATAEQQVVPAIKDAVFVVAYAILLIVAIPEAGG